MPVRSHAFPTHGARPTVQIRNPAGSVSVTGVEGATEAEVVVEPLNGPAERMLDQVVVEFLRSGPEDVEPAGARLLVAVPPARLLSSPRFAITVTVPAGCPVSAAVASADATLCGRLAVVDLTGASGDLRIESCTGLHLRTASGDVQAAEVAGPVEIRSASGEVRLDDVAGPVTVTTASGDVALGRVGGDVDVRTASADVSVGRVSGGEVELRTVSGDATVAVGPGLVLWLDLQSVSGTLHSQLDTSAAPDAEADPATVSVRMRSVSGDLRLRRAG